MTTDLRAMRHRRIALVTCILLSLTFGWIGRGQSVANGWKDQGESDIGLAAQNAKDLAQRLELLKKWEQQYPETAFQSQRTFMETQTLTGLVTAGFGKPLGPALSSGVSAAKRLIEGMNTYFDDGLLKLPDLAKTSPEDWAKIRSTSEMQAHALLAYDATLRKDDATAEAEYEKVLKIDPTQAGTSYQLGAAMLHEMTMTKTFVRFSEALYELARSLTVSGPNALPQAGKDVAEKFLKANYSNYHGGAEGLEELMRQAGASALPPDGFHIPSAQDVADAKQKEHDVWALAHPELDFWKNIQGQLTARGDAFFKESLDGVALPPPAGDIYKGGTMFQGTVVSVTDGKQILVNVDNAAGDALLKLDESMKGEVPAGTSIRFKGVVDGWSKDPQRISFAVEDPKADLAGLPDGVTFGPGKVTRTARPGKK